MEMNYCRRCGSALTKRSPKVYVCTNQHTIFLASTPTVGIFFITPDNKVVLSRRGIDPHKGMLDSIGGFVDDEESLEQAAIREIKEELGLNEDEYGTLNYLTSAVGHYPYGGEVVTTLSSFFWADISSLDIISPQDDVAEVIALDIDEINPSELHDTDIVEGVKALRKTIKQADNKG